MDQREQIRRLDRCLTLLEDAHERDEVVVSASLAGELRPLLPGLAVGVPIGQALDRVFAEQEAYLPSRSPDVRADPADEEPGAQPHLCRSRAEELTRRIRLGSQMVCLLMLEAHEGRAWTALGYPSWERYVRREFDQSRRRSYELVDQGRVIRALQAVSGTSGPPSISAYAALQIKPHLDEVANLVRRRSAGLPEATRTEIVHEVVADVRRRVGAKQGHRPPGDGGGFSIDRLLQAIEALSEMPEPAVAIAAIPRAQRSSLADLDSVAEWLVEFARLVRKPALVVSEPMTYAMSG